MVGKNSCRQAVLLCMILVLSACSARVTAAEQAPPALGQFLWEQPLPEQSLPDTESRDGEMLLFTDTPWENPALDEALDQIAEKYQVVGCSIAAFEDGQIVYTHSYGYADQENGIPADEETIYRAASISKLVTTMLVMQLVEQGNLRLTDHVEALISPQLKNPWYPEEAITLEMLLTHTSSIVDGTGYLWALDQASFPPLTEVLKGNVFNHSCPGAAYCYSNFGLGLACAAVEQASGQRFYNYAQQTLFEKMVIDAAFVIDYIEQPEKIAHLGVIDPARDWANMKAAYDRIPQGQMYLLGHGELYIKAKDLAAIASILAGDGTYRGTRYLSEESLDQIHVARVHDEASNVTRGLAVQISEGILSGTTLYGHQGNAYGSISCVFYDPQGRRGVAFLSNGARSGLTEDMVYLVSQEVVREVWQYL